MLRAEYFSTLSSIANLASIYRNRRWKEAKKLEVQVIKIRKRVLRAKYLDMLTSITNLALMYRSQK